jgi:hypothetical protein
MIEYPVKISTFGRGSTFDKSSITPWSFLSKLSFRGLYAMLVNKMQLVHICLQLVHRFACKDFDRHTTSYELLRYKHLAVKIKSPSPPKQIELTEDVKYMSTVIVR